MAKKIKAIVLDVDGVIVGEKIGVNSPNPHADVIAKMKAVRDTGIKVILCTAKPHYSIASIIKDANLDTPHITDGGGVLVNPIDNTILKKFVVDPKQARIVIDACIKNDIYTEVYTPQEYIIQRSQVCQKTHQHTHILQTEPSIVDDLVATAQEITKIMPVVNGEQGKQEFTKFFNSLNTNLALNWGIHPIALPLQFGIITAKGISKKQGMLDILASLGISADETLAVGDSTSDWNFIEPCGYGVAMGNASQQLKDHVATKGEGKFLIGGDVDDNGIIEVLDYFTID